MCSLGAGVCRMGSSSSDFSEQIFHWNHELDCAVAIADIFKLSIDLCILFSAMSCTEATSTPLHVYKEHKNIFFPLTRIPTLTNRSINWVLEISTPYASQINGAQGWTDSTLRSIKAKKYVATGQRMVGSDHNSLFFLRKRSCNIRYIHATYIFIYIYIANWISACVHAKYQLKSTWPFLQPLWAPLQVPLYNGELCCNLRSWAMTTTYPLDLGGWKQNLRCSLFQFIKGGSTNLSDTNGR